ncbi:MAG: hypothetical protein NZ898_06015 [Myxococcota bacterium]|nr:hypothetical protein [Myxococcota bacterium]MDW8362167.1 hypothetical protein [Myxococcales bacterium]
MSAYESFVSVVRQWLLSLPQDAKALLRIVDDADVDDESRVLAAGALLHLLSSHNAIPGMRGILALVDDALVLRLVLERAESRSPDAMARHREQSPELFDPLAEQMRIARAYLGDLMSVLDRAVDALPRMQHQGHDARRCVHDTESSTWLYDAVQEAIVERLELREDDVARESKGVDRILPQLRSRLVARS